MNERIMELFEQAHIQPPVQTSGQFAFTPPKTFSPEKFAELIVREAAAFVSGSAEVYNQAEQDACVRASKGLMKHFGVE